MQIQNGSQNCESGENLEKVREDSNKNYIRNLIQKDLQIKQNKYIMDQFEFHVTHKIQLKNITPHNYSYCKYLLSGASQLQEYSGKSSLIQQKNESSFKNFSKTMECNYFYFLSNPEEQEYKKYIENVCKVQTRILVGRIQFYIEKYFIKIDSVLAKERFVNQLKLIFDILKGNADLYNQNRMCQMQKNELEEQKTDI